MLIKGRRSPVRCRGMAGCAVSRQSELLVIGVVRSVKVLLVAGHTFRRRAFKTLVVTFDTVCHRMRTGQRECRHIVVEDVIRTAGGVASKACIRIVYITANQVVLLIGFSHFVAGRTRDYRVVPGSRVAVNTLRPLTRMLPAVYREELTIVIKGRWHPGGFTMALGAFH